MRKIPEQKVSMSRDHVILYVSYRLSIRKSLTPVTPQAVVLKR